MSDHLPAQKRKRSKPVAAYEYAVVQIITIAKFRRPANPRRCDIHRYHVWRWRSPMKLELDKLKDHMPQGLKCQCGGLS